MVSIWTRYISGVTKKKKDPFHQFLSQNPTMRPDQLRASCRLIWEKNQTQLKPGSLSAEARIPLSYQPHDPLR